jgi:hypothetical protein
MAALAIAALVASGCARGTTDMEPTTLVCEPACPRGQTCTAAGCASGDGGMVADIGIAMVDFAGCVPACAGSTPYCNSGVCVACLVDDHCPTGQVCHAIGAGAACVPGCANDARCGAGMKCCGARCIDPMVDPANCGKCGAPCSGGHASSACQAGVCTLGSCAAGWADCNKDPADGCEAKLDFDVNNCGMCGVMCAIAHAAALCGPGGCYLSACNFGYDDCNSDAKDGCETSTTSDLKNCGGCGMQCGALPNAVVACVNGACGLTACKPGFADCDRMAKNGCEQPITNDRNNCGGCGVACGMGQVCVNGACTCANCNINNAKTKCVNNMCVFDQCLPNFADCNNDLSDGCEADLSGDKNNCAACGKACAPGLSCVKGACIQASCRNGAVQKSLSPGGDMMICKDQGNATCEQDFATLCPMGWRLCTYKQHDNRRSGWVYALDQGAQSVALGEISCRGVGGNSGAGHFTIPDSNNQPRNVGDKTAFNCYFGSSRASCVTGYGCNEQFAAALCCAPTKACGNGIVDDVEEDCDDGNNDDTDACLSNCMWRVPRDHGLNGTNC